MPDEGNYQQNPSSMPMPSNVGAVSGDGGASGVPAPASAAAPVDDVVVRPDANVAVNNAAAEGAPDVENVVLQQIEELHNVLVTLSASPTVDELAAAIGLTIYLDKMGKHATAIYSGTTPNALKFLKPEETFEESADVLQDFVIALNKDKADHLRYKLDGDFVRIFITPFRSRISVSDLDYSYGDYNVDLVLALNVASEADFDDALREHGRIMHDAVVVDVTTKETGGLGGIEWTDTEASSISEMLAKMILGLEEPMEGEEATAFLTGIVAATNHFSNDNTTPETMAVAARLMQCGADQQLISQNIALAMSGSKDTEKAGGAKSLTELRLRKDEVKKTTEPNAKKSKLSFEDLPGFEKPKDTLKKTSELKDKLGLVNRAQASSEKPDVSESELPKTIAPVSEEIKVPASEASAISVADVSVATANPPEPMAGATEVATAIPPETMASVPEAATTTPTEPMASVSEATTSPMPSLTEMDGDQAEAMNNERANSEPSVPANGSLDLTNVDNDNYRNERTIQPSMAFTKEMGSEEQNNNKYGQMLQDALKGGDDGDLPQVVANEENMTAPMMSNPVMESNPAETNAPSVPSHPEINGVPEMNYMPMPGDQVLPPPPAPPINMDMPMNNAMNGMEMAPPSMPMQPPVSANGGEPAGEMQPIQPAVETMQMPQMAQSSSAVMTPMPAMQPMGEPGPMTQPGGAMSMMQNPLVASPMGYSEAPMMQSQLPTVMMGQTQPEEVNNPASFVAPAPMGVENNIPSANPVPAEPEAVPEDPGAFRIPGIK